MCNSAGPPETAVTCYSRSEVELQKGCAVSHEREIDSARHLQRVGLRQKQNGNPQLVDSRDRKNDSVKNHCCSVERSVRKRMLTLSSVMFSLARQPAPIAIW